MATKVLKTLKPDAVFAVLTTTRRSIAQDLNDAINDNKSNVPRFKNNDDRLSNEMCNIIAKRQGRVYEEDYDEEERNDAIREAMKEILLEFFS